MTPEGLMTCPSHYGPRETMDRLASAVAEHGMTVLARIDHASAAAKVGLELRPTEVLLFANPKQGTPLMQAAQTMGIDLPLKALVWQDEAGKTWLSYNDPRWLARRHGIETSVQQPLAAMIDVLEAIVKDTITRTEGGAS
jgi:uncharacterized protein (DUF302 family)